MKHLESGYCNSLRVTGVTGKQKEGEVNSMRLVKRITAAAMALTMTAALAGCGSSSGSTSTTAAADTTAHLT